MNNITKSDGEWKRQLSPEQYRILRGKGTESPFSGKYDQHFEKGSYVCAGCGSRLFVSSTKYDAGCGWPSFYDAEGNAVELRQDIGHGMKRTEVLCRKCSGHLGHIFSDGPKPTGKRFCINSAALEFKKK